MNIIEFTEKFKDEKSCRMYLKAQREKEGITCKKCLEITKHYWLGAVEKWQCSKCNSRTNLRAGTIMEKSKMSVYKWFLAIHLMSSIKKPFSALEMQRQLGHKFYEPVLDMVNKIRATMGNRDNRYKLKGCVEIDEGFFEVVNLDKKDSLGNVIEEKKKVKQGRGSDKRSVLVMVESAKVEQKSKHKKDRVMGYVKMIVMDDLSGSGINYEVAKNIDSNATVLTDKYKGYSKIDKLVHKHESMVVPSKKADKMLPWVHTIIANAKRQLLGVHHSVGTDNLQNHLNEFCYKLNRRNFTTDLFDRILIASVA